MKLKLTCVCVCIRFNNSAFTHRFAMIHHVSYAWYIFHYWNTVITLSAHSLRQNLANYL